MNEDKLKLIFNDIYNKYEDYNRGLIDGKTPCRDCKMAFTIDYLKGE